MKMEGFKEVDYNTLQKEIKKVYNSDEIPEIQIAAQVNVKSVQTVRNAFMPDKQIVSDELLSNVLSILGLNSFIVWQNGQRAYFIKK